MDEDQQVAQASLSRVKPTLFDHVGQLGHLSLGMKPTVIGRYTLNCSSASGGVRAPTSQLKYISKSMTRDMAWQFY